jgi:hypothetical protein
MPETRFSAAGASLYCRQGEQKMKKHYVNGRSRVCRALQTACLLLGLAGLSACGGGGGGGASGAAETNISATFEPTVPTATIVEGQLQQPIVSFNVALNYNGTRNIFLGTQESDGLLVDYGITVTGLKVSGSMRFDVTRMAGNYDGRLRLLACYDTECKEQVPGSPMIMPIRLTVKPNLQVPNAIVVRRKGAEAAPAVDTPVAVPAEAGQLVLEGLSFSRVLQVQWTGSAVRVLTQPAQAGQYQVQGTLRSLSDARYQKTFVVDYEVQAPDGGERPFAFDPPTSSVVVEQGSIYRGTFRLQRPTWLVSSAQPQLASNTTNATVRALGNDFYELTYNASGQEVGAFEWFDIVVSGGEWAGEASSRWNFRVGSAFSVGNLSTTLNNSSRLSDLRLSAPVTVASGPPARWTAVSAAPWVRVLRSSGTTGSDLLEVEIDQVTATATVGDVVGSVDVSIDRAGTTPASIPVSTRLAVTALNQATTGALLSGSGTLYVDGRLLYPGLESGLQITGATVRSVTYPYDTRFVGSNPVLKLELENLVAGQHVTVRAPWPLLATAVSVPVVARSGVPAAYQVLPHAPWRSAQFSHRQQALYFAAPNTVVRWGLAGNSWAMNTTTVAGLLDVAPAGDETYLIGAGGVRYWRLDAASLALVDQEFFTNLGSSTMVNDMLPTPQRRLAFAADGRAWTALSSNAFDAAAALTQVIGLIGLQGQGEDPCCEAWRAVPAGAGARVGLVRSSGGQVMLAQFADGAVRRYDAATRLPRQLASSVGGMNLRAVSDDGSRWLRADGVVHVDTAALAGSLHALVPGDFSVGGHALTGSGRHALLYVYRQVQESGAPRARDAALWVIDISGVAAGGIAAASIESRLTLTDAVGCTAALASAETCAHEASVVISPGDFNAFVLGPRGVTSVPLPASVRAAGTRSQRAAAPRPWVPNGVPYIPQGAR